MPLISQTSGGPALRQKLGATLLALGSHDDLTPLALKLKLAQNVNRLTY